MSQAIEILEPPQVFFIPLGYENCDVELYSCMTRFLSPEDPPFHKVLSASLWVSGSCISELEEPGERLEFFGPGVPFHRGLIDSKIDVKVCIKFQPEKDKKVIYPSLTYSPKDKFDAKLPFEQSVNIECYGCTRIVYNENGIDLL